LPSSFAALIHNVDHPEVPNEQLVNEDNPLAVKYKGRSVTEQHSLETAWCMFMEKNFAAMRQCICPYDHELTRFSSTCGERCDCH
jgi:hypothetical protein